MSAALNLHILTLCEAENTAKRIENQLRNAGHAIRIVWTAQPDDVPELLKTHNPSLVLCEASVPSERFSRVVGLCNQHDATLPVLLLSHRYSVAQTLSALDHGARDQVSDEDAAHTRHLLHVCLREITAYQNECLLRQTRAQAVAVESRTKNLLSASTDAIASVAEGIFTEVNPAFAKLLNYPKPKELVGLPLMDCIASPDQARAKEYLKQLLKGKATAQSHAFSLVRADQSTLTTEIAFSLDQSGDEVSVQLLIRAPKPVGGDAGVSAGRLAFLKQLKNAIERPATGMSAALMLTVDHFREIEARLGFAGSDDLMVQFMKWLRERLTASDVVGRVSIDELALIVVRPNVVDIETLCKTFCREIQKQVFATQKNETHITVSVAAYPFVADDKPDTLLNQLAQAARQLSAEGGNRHHLLGATAESAEQARLEAQKANSIKLAAEENRLRLAYQSISSLEGDPRLHWDILLRMLDASGQETLAADFMGTAEKFGLTRALDRWVCAHVLKLLATRKATEDPLTCFIKLSEETLKDAEGFVTWLNGITQQRPLKPGDLVFALQEVHLQNHIRKGKTLTKALHDLGANVAIERFGKGTHSPQMLDHIPANYIKLDPEFTRDFSNSALQKQLTQLMEIAKRKHIKVVVSHVEDANHMARLWQLGVNLVQGFLIQEPAPFPGK